MSAIDKRVESLIANFDSFSNWEDKYKAIINIGKDLGDLPEEHRLESNKVKGCQSQVWLHAELQGDKIIYMADSDAAIVKGIIALLLNGFPNDWNWIWRIS